MCFEASVHIMAKVPRFKMAGLWHSRRMHATCCENENWNQALIPFEFWRRAFHNERSLYSTLDLSKLDVKTSVLIPPPPSSPLVHSTIHHYCKISLVSHVHVFITHLPVVGLRIFVCGIGRQQTICPWRLIRYQLNSACRYANAWLACNPDWR